MALQPLELKAALNLAALVLEFEAENTQADEWRAEVRRAKLAIDQALKRPPAGEFFLSAAERPSKLKSTNHSNQTEETKMLKNRTKLVKAFGESRVKSIEEFISAVADAADAAGIEKKEAGQQAREAAILAYIDQTLSEMTAFIAQVYGSTVAGKSKKFDLIVHLNNISKAAKDTPPGRKAAPAQPGPLFAGNQAGMAELLHKGGDFNATLAAAAAQTKAKNYNGDNKR